MLRVRRGACSRVLLLRRALRCTRWKSEWSSGGFQRSATNRGLASMISAGESADKPALPSNKRWLLALGWTLIITAAVGVFGHYRTHFVVFPGDYYALLTDIRFVIDERPELAPTLLRLIFAQNACHIFNFSSNITSANTAYLRFAETRTITEHAGLDEVVDTMANVCQLHSSVSVMDVWTLAACVAIEKLGGPPVVSDWRFGRIDAALDRYVAAPELLPKAERGGEVGCLKNMAEFARMGLTLQDYVVLLGTHSVGGMHESVSGYSGTWTKTPTRFNNEYYRNLVSCVWEADGPPPTGVFSKLFEAKPAAADEPRPCNRQYRCRREGLAMLPCDVALLQNAETRALVKKYALDEEAWLADYRAAWLRFSELNMEHELKPVVPRSEYPSLAVFSVFCVGWMLRGAYRWVTDPPARAQKPSLPSADTIAYMKGRLREMVDEVEEKDGSKAGT
ncbi:putative heme-binding peroxidase [Diplonema papillatum]|nr:putative heme-binding peroxidase [Diplonema papillatum]